MIGSPPFTHLVAVDDIPPAGLALEITATEAERRALADRNGLPGVASLAARLQLRHEGRAGIRVTGQLEAAVIQTCVVSLEPFPAVVREPIDVGFQPLDAIEALRASRPADPSREEPRDEPDAIEAGRIDLGALLAEHLTLGLDPYPRKPGAALDNAATAPDETASPFAVLRDLRRDPS